MGWNRHHTYRLFCALFAVGFMPMWVGSASAQTASTSPAFEVATIKPADMTAFNGTHFGADVHQARVTYWFVSLKYLVTYAYGVLTPQVSGPGWTDTDHYNIEARFPKGATKEDEKRMLQALLKDRFNLSFHIERKELEVYAMVVGKHGAKLKPSAPDSPLPATDAPLKDGESYIGEGDKKRKVSTNRDGSSTINLGSRGTQTLKMDMESGAMHFERSKITMEELAGNLPICVGKELPKVEDQTGIKGTFQVAWDCPMGLPRPAMGTDASDPTASDPQGGGVLAKSLDALGLKLEKHKVPMDIYVIDHVEKPSEN
jgi:uncharacterized protein (TIGR03435 family)